MLSNVRENLRFIFNARMLFDATKINFLLLNAKFHYKKHNIFADVVLLFSPMIELSGFADCNGTLSSTTATNMTNAVATQRNPS